MIIETENNAKDSTTIVVDDIVDIKVTKQDGKYIIEVLDNNCYDIIVK